MFHHPCGARCAAYDGYGVCKCRSTRDELRDYKLKCVSPIIVDLRINETLQTGAVFGRKCAQSYGTRSVPTTIRVLC